VRESTHTVRDVGARFCGSATGDSATTATHVHACAHATPHAALMEAATEAATFATLVETAIMKPARMKSRASVGMSEENVIEAMATMIEVKKEER